MLSFQADRVDAFDIKVVNNFTASGIDPALRKEMRILG
jgi:hypothetical protein